MRHERATEELRELAALYALGSLTQQEAQSFEVHRKEGCPVCEAEFRKFRRAVAGIGMAADETAPPEYIRDLLSARIEREPQPAPVIPAVQADRKKPAPTPPRPAPAFSALIQSQKEGPNMLPWVLAATLAILGLLAAYGWRSVSSTNEQLKANLSAAEEDTKDLGTMLDMRREKIENLDRILSAAGKPGSRIARLVLQSASPEYSGAVIWDTELDECIFLGHFPLPPEGKKYQLWFFTQAAKVSAGFLNINPAGKTFAKLPVAREAANAGAAVVTLEPDNGSLIPTSPYYAVGRID